MRCRAGCRLIKCLLFNAGRWTVNAAQVEEEANLRAALLMALTLMLRSTSTALYLLFFLRDGRDLAQTIRRAVPMQRQHTDFLLSKFAHRGARHRQGHYR